VQFVSSPESVRDCSTRSILFKSKMSAPSICRRVCDRAQGKRTSMSASITEMTPSSPACGSASWMLNTSASARPAPWFRQHPVGRDFLDDFADRCLKFAEQRTTNTAAAELSDPHVLPSMTFVSIAISPNSFMTMAIFAGWMARMCRSNVVLPLPSGAGD